LAQVLTPAIAEPVIEPRCDIVGHYQGGKAPGIRPVCSHTVSTQAAEDAPPNALTVALVKIAFNMMIKI
jgi:hypothetical protein